MPLQTLSLALLLTDPALIAPPPDDQITVTAPRTDAETTAQAARTYADSVLPTPVYGQFARWRGPVCVKITGIDPAYAPRIAARIRAVARAASVPVASDMCRPNLLIVFTPDARRTVEVMAGRKPRMLARLTETERRAVREAALPVRWWYSIVATDRNGVAAAPTVAAVASLPGGGNTLPTNPDTVMTGNYGSSIIDTNLISAVTGAVAVVDVPLATGTTLDALADYLALVTLAPTRLPPQSPGVPSILNLFGPADTARPQGLSGWDSAYLAGLYQSVASRRAGWQRGQIVEHVKTAMEP